MQEKWVDFDQKNSQKRGNFDPIWTRFGPGYPGLRPGSGRSINMVSTLGLINVFTPQVPSNLTTLGVETLQSPSVCGTLLFTFRSYTEVSSYQEHSKEDESPYHGARKF